ncbi:MAG TPA: MarR family transcriptional regulator [Devosia sp.]|jgi:DNA-binding MarR family transcriptional regulator|nr:MarR family transcriptional regulator [Devosia sp.]
MHQDNQSSSEKRRLLLLERIGNLSRQSQSATDLFDERISEFLGINRTDGRCLDLIGREGKVSAGQLANEADLTTGAVTAVIDRLERAGYVQRVRDPVDRRKVWVECTPHTTELVQTIFGVYDLLGPIMLEHFSEDQLAGIVTFLRIGTRINEELAAALRENTKPGAAQGERASQAKLFRKAVDAGAGRLTAELKTLAAPETD